MKKLFIAAVLIAALGGALYYFSEMQKPQSASPGLKNVVIGIWQIDSVALSAKDSGNAIALFALSLNSNFLKYSYEFKEDGAIIKKLGDSTLAEKINYQFKDSAGIIITEDETFELMFTEKLKDGFVLMDKDSAAYYFKRKL